MAASPCAKRDGGDVLNYRRSAARIVLLPTDCLAGETIAFDLLVNGVYAGHWAETQKDRATVTWLDGVSIEAEPCAGETEKLIAHLRPTIPARQLGLEEAALPPKYDVTAVEAVILDIVAEGHPDHLLTEALLLGVVGDPGDAREVEVGNQAIRSLRKAGLLAERDDGRVEPTPAAIRAVALLI